MSKRLPDHAAIQKLLEKLPQAEAEVRKSVSAWLPGLIDHTLLKPEATEAQLHRLCAEAREHRFATVCVNSSQVEFCAKELQGSGVKPIAVVGFPLGASLRAAKRYEARLAVKKGAQEIDMVLAIGKLKDKKYRYIYQDIRRLVEAVAPVPVKVILETCLLTDEEKVRACQIAAEAGAAFVKTSTGFSTGGATVADVQLMRRTVSAQVEVKASGGVRTLEDALKMVGAGATRIGTSNGVTIVGGGAAGKGY